MKNLLLIITLMVGFLLVVGCSDSATPGFNQLDGSQNGDAAADQDAPQDTIEDSGKIPFKDGMICVPGSSQCVGNKFLTCNDEGSDWNIEICEDGTTCTTKGCIQAECQPGQSRCDENGDVEVCKPDGSGWSEPAACERANSALADSVLPRNVNPAKRSVWGTSWPPATSRATAGTPRNAAKRRSVSKANASSASRMPIVPKAWSARMGCAWRPLRKLRPRTCRPQR